MNNLSGTKVKNLQVLIKKIELEKENLHSQKKALLADLQLKEKQLYNYKEELSKLQKNSGTLIVSEHAMIRYLQRVYKLDLQKIEQEILTPDIQERIICYGNGSYNSEEFGIKVVDNVIVTVFDKIKDERQADKKSFLKRISDA